MGVQAGHVDGRVVGKGAVPDDAERLVCGAVPVPVVLISRSAASIRNAELYTAARPVCTVLGTFVAQAGVEAITAATKSSLLLE